MSQPITETLGMPPLRPWIRNLLIGLFVLYVLELVVKNPFPSVYRLAWPTFWGGDFAVWQVFTRYLVQVQSPFNVLLGLLGLYFSLPWLDRALTPRQLSQAAASVFLFGTLFAAGFNLLGLAGGADYGWSAFALASFALLGLLFQDTTVNLFFVLPVKGLAITAIECVMAVLLYLYLHDMWGAEQIGASVGVLAWWYGLGPGARRRKLIRESQKITKELSKFEVLQGGRNRDDIVH